MWDNVPDPITGKVKKENKRKKAHIASYIKSEVLARQNNLCVGPRCAEMHNGKSVKINDKADFDHIKPEALGGKTNLKNIQGLCPGCHRMKTKKDRYDISQAKKKQKAKESKSPPSLFGSPSKSKKSVGLFGEPGDLSDLNMFSTKGKKKKKPKSIWDM